MTLAAVWSDDAFLHDPDGEMWIGLPLEGDEAPPRAAAMKEAIDAAGLTTIGAPAAFRLGHHHSPRAGMLSYLETPHNEWLAAGYRDEHGQDRVVAYAFRHPHAFDHVGRVDARSRAARAGLYCMDTCSTIGPGSYRGIRYAVDAALTAADAVLSGGG